MYNTTDAYRKAVASNSRLWDLYVLVDLADGTHLRLDRTKIALNSFKWKNGSTCSDTIQTGSTYAASVEFSIVNKDAEFADYVFTGAKIFPFIGLYIESTEDYEYVPLGEFNIIEPVKQFSTIPVVCYDNMVLTNQVFDFSTVVFPTDARTVFLAVVDQCGFRYDEQMLTDISNLDYEINSLLTNDPTCRDVLAGFGIMLQRNLRFNRAGTLELFWYQEVPVRMSKYTRTGNSSYADVDTRVTGVVLEDAYGNTFNTGTEVYPVALPNSPIVQGSDMSIPVLEATLESMQAIQYKASKISYIGDPALDVGDIVTQVDTPVGEHKVPIMLSVYKFTGIQTIESLGLNSATMTQQSSTVKRLRKVFSAAQKDRAELESKISQTADTVRLEVSEKYATQQVVSELQVQANGLQAAVSKSEQDLVGVATELTQLRQSTTDVEIAIQTIRTEGVSRVTTTSNYTFDEDGLSIKKSGEEIENLINNNGMYVKRSGTVMLQATAAGVVATDVQVNNYLCIGKYARFEDYTDGMDSKRTACFWLGGE